MWFASHPAPVRIQMYDPGITVYRDAYAEPGNSVRWRLHSVLPTLVTPRQTAAGHAIRGDVECGIDSRAMHMHQ
jgi:hypothetical protein